jgi:nucleoside-diphosphate-sugar epimerase
MRIFVTGATGWIGSAVVSELIAADHQVVGLARTDAAAKALSDAGAQTHRGSLEDLESLRRGAAAADGVIHLAFFHAFAHASIATRMRVMISGSPRGIVSRFRAASLQADRRAIEALGTALTGTDRALVVAYGTMGIAPGHVLTEEDAADSNAAGSRSQSEADTLALAARGVRSVIVRIAPSVHGPGDHGFVKSLIDTARTKGISAYVGDGSNRWPAVHRLDAAHLFKLAVETAPDGSRLHAVGDEGVPFRDIADVIGRHLNLPVVSITREKAVSHFGWIGALVGVDNPTSSALTQERLKWRPGHPALIPDLEEGHYFSK